MRKPVSSISPGDIITAFVWPNGRTQAMRGGPLTVSSVQPTGGQWAGIPQFEIKSTNRNRAARYTNGATHVIVANAHNVEDAASG